MRVREELCCQSCGSLRLAPVKAQVVSGTKITETTHHGTKSRIGHTRPDFDGAEIVVFLQCESCRVITKFSFLHSVGKTYLSVGRDRAVPAKLPAIWRSDAKAKSP